ncbi:MAG: hypothetical protein IJT59_02585 [Desulfovibrionaceae bacterium]|nr:hypothetical protein [Desulfovibrionaceae bacterium]
MLAKQSARQTRHATVLSLLWEFTVKLATSYNIHAGHTYNRKKQGITVVCVFIKEELGRLITRDFEGRCFVGGASRSSSDGIAIGLCLPPRG